MAWIVRLRTTPPTIDEYEFWQRLYDRWWPEDERHYPAGGYCPFYEAFPSEDIGYGNFPVAGYPFGERCHHPDTGETLSCKGQYCNCPLSVETWQNAWRDKLIIEGEA